HAKDHIRVQLVPGVHTCTLHIITYSSTQTFSWVPGSSHTIATTSPQSGATGVRYVWSSWTGGGAISHTVAPTTNKTYTATFNTRSEERRVDREGRTRSACSW